MKPGAITQYVIDALGIVITLIVAVSGPLLVLTACEPKLSLTNDEIIAEVKKCNDAGLAGQVIFDRHKRNVIKVQCITKIKESVAGPVISSEA